MALKPTIYKFKIALSDLNNDYYDSLNLIVAQHPSETTQRMLARVLAFCLHKYQDPEKLLVFTKGLSSVDEPDIWLRGLDDQLYVWIDLGEPSFDRVKKSCRLSKQSFLYCFNSKSDVWWKQSQAQFSTLPVNVLQFQWEDIQRFSQHLSRTMDLSITLSAETAYIALQNEQVEVNWSVLQAT
jgi:uncharacterized protein YaeQ